MSMHLKHSAGIPPSARLDRRGPVWGRPVFRGNAQVFVEHQPRNTKGANAGNTRILQKAAYVFLWLFAFAMPWENALRIPGFGTVSRAVGLAAFGVGLMAVLDSGRLRTPTVQHILMVLFVTWVGLTYFWSFEPSRTRIAAITFLQLLAMVWLIWEFAQTWKQQILLLRAFVLGTLVSSIAIVLSFLSGPATGAGGTYYGRYTGLGFNPGDLALILALSLPISLYLAARDEGWRFRVWFYGVHLVLAISAILLAASRGALIASAGALLMLPVAFSQLTRGQKTVGVTLVALLGVGAAFTVPQSSWSRLGTIGAEVSSGTLNERTMIWQAGWVVFGQSPFRGVGAAAFAPSVEHAMGMPFHGAGSDDGGPVNVELVAHNTFISVLVEQGVIGFALFLAILLTLVFSAWQFPVVDRVFWLSLLLTWAIGVSSLTWEDRKPSWFIFGILAAAAAAQIPSINKARRSRPTPGPRLEFGPRGPMPARGAQFGRWS
jgi:O-antigen ligase